jgi:hypothetical protein
MTRLATPKRPESVRTGTAPNGGSHSLGIVLFGVLL